MRSTKLFMTFVGAGVTATLALQASALPVDPGTNNLAGVAAGLQENYVRPTNTEYYAPNELGQYLTSTPSSGVGPGPQSPGDYESIRIDSGTGAKLGINIAQPAYINTATDIRSTTGNSIAGGLPLWGERTGVVARLDTNTTSSNTYFLTPPTGNVSAIAYGFTPSSATSSTATDDGLAPGSAPGDGIPDFVPFVGNVASITVTYYGSSNDPSGAAGLFTPHIRIYEGGAPFTLTANGATLNEADFNQNNGSLSTGTIAPAVDGTLLLDAIVVNGPSATNTWILNADGTVSYSLNANGGTVQYVGGSLVASGQVAFGSTGSFGFNLQQLLFTNTSGVDDGQGGSPDQFDFAALTPGSSASGNIGLTIVNPVPEPITMGLSTLALAGLAGYVKRRRVQA